MLARRRTSARTLEGRGGYVLRLFQRQRCGEHFDLWRSVGAARGTVSGFDDRRIDGQSGSIRLTFHLVLPGNVDDGHATVFRIDTRVTL